MSENPRDEAIERYFQIKKDRIQQYLDKKAELRAMEDKLGGFKLLRYLPYPNQLISGIVALAILLIGATYFPQAVDYVVMNWLPQGIDNRSMFLIAVGWAMVSSFLLAALMLFGGPARIFLKSKIFGRDVIEVMRTSGVKEYKVPKDEIAGVVELDDNYAFEASEDGYYTGPNGRRMTTVVPEYPMNFNPRKLLEGVKSGLDMMTLKVYGQKHEQRQWEKMRTHSDEFIKFIPWIIGLLVVAAIFGPMAWSKVKDMSEADNWRQQYESCRVDMLNSGVVPSDLKEKYKEEKKEGDPTEQKPSFGGVSLIK